MSELVVGQDSQCNASEHSGVMPLMRRIGRPALLHPSQKQQRINVCLDKSHQEIALQAGSGNLSAGVRIALAAWATSGREND